MPSTDILSGVDSILDKVKQNAYSSQFDMELELSRLIDSAYDSHLVFQFCSQSIFALTVDQPIVSISKDGLALPQVYTLGVCHSKANSFRANRWLQTMPNFNKVDQKISRPLNRSTVQRLQTTWNQSL